VKQIWRGRLTFVDKRGIHYRLESEDENLTFFRDDEIVQHIGQNDLLVLEALALAQADGRSTPLTKEELYRAGWGTQLSDNPDNRVQQAISKIRSQKVLDDKEEQIIKTYTAPHGYKLSPPVRRERNEPGGAGEERGGESIVSND
jgi:DNA-binding winged helix-turn-helix (wHTH) protein